MNILKVFLVLFLIVAPIVMLTAYMVDNPTTTWVDAAYVVVLAVWACLLAYVSYEAGKDDKAN